MTPSKEAMDAASEIMGWIAREIGSHHQFAAIIDRHFADVIRKAAALDTLTSVARIHDVAVGINANGIADAWICQGDSVLEGTKPSLAAAVESLAAKIGMKPHEGSSRDDV